MMLTVALAKARQVDPAWNEMRYVQHSLSATAYFVNSDSLNTLQFFVFARIFIEKPVPTFSNALVFLAAHFYRKTGSHFFECALIRVEILGDVFGP